MNQNRQATKKSPIFIVMAIMIVIPLIIISGAFYYYNSVVNTPLGKSADMVKVTIDVGESRDAIAQKMVDSGLLSKSSNMILYMKISKEGGNIQAGDHYIPHNATLKELVKILEEKPSEDTIWVTIPEGLRYDEIAEILAKGFEGKEGNKFNKDEFLAICKEPRKSNGKLGENVAKILAMTLPNESSSIEGFLYPDTYNLKVGVDASEVITKLISTLTDEKLTTEDYSEIKNSKYSLYETINIASMLEREARNNEEAPIIADIIIRRLETGYPLGIDATSLYELKDWKATLDFKILENSTPYNTRTNVGLPPTPISNPGIDTIRAVIKHQDNEYFFYLHDNNGVIHYGKTNAEHNRNIEKYL